MIPRIAHFHWEGEPINWLRLQSINSFARLNPKWDVMLWRTPEDIRAHNLPMYAHEADWTWWRMLHKFGGFALGTDSVFVKPMPEEWLEADICYCPGTFTTFHHMAIGSAPGTRFLAECLEECEKRKDDCNTDQTLGVTLLNDVARKHRSDMSASFMTEAAYTPISSTDVERLWAGRDIDLPDDTIGVHWFGGHPASKVHEPRSGPGYPAYIVRLAEEATK